MTTDNEHDDQAFDVRDETTNVITSPYTMQSVIETLAHWLIRRKKTRDAGQDSLDVMSQLRDCRVTNTGEQGTEARQRS